MDCTCVILSACVLVNVFLIVLVAFQEDRYVEEHHITSSKYDFEPFSEYLERFKNNINSLEVGLQRLNDVFSSTEDLKTVNLQFSKHHIHATVKLIAMKQRLLRVKSKVDQLKNKLGEVTSVIDGIKSDFDGIELSLNMLELDAYQDDHIERIESLKGELGMGLDENYDYELQDEINDFLVNFGPLFSDKTTHEDLSSDYQSCSDEESDSNEVMSPMERFKLYKEKVNWTQAAYECYAESMRLVSITSPAEQEQIVELIKKADLENADFWTSGKDHSGTFVWETTGSLVTYSNWTPGEPNLIPDLQEEDHCLSLVYDFDYRWNVSDCSERKYFVCEKQWSWNE